MAKIIISPGRYIQGKGEMNNISKHIGELGKNFFFLVSKSGQRRVAGTISRSFEGTGAKVIYEIFNGECSDKEIERLRAIYKENDCDVVVGVGGGKILDTTKAIGYYEGSPVVIIPTIASTDAPCSALSVIYKDDGVFDRYLVLPKNPDIVLVDTEVVAKAPARLLVSGMGDALATYFEARACVESNASNLPGGSVTLAAYALAKLCYETLMSDGLKAKMAAERGVVTEALEKVVEANTLLSGLGFESGGLAGAHAIHNGFTALEECHHLYHGEKVAFGTITQLVLENAAMEELEKVISFCRSLGLPTTLADMGINEVKEENIMKVAELSCAEGETIYNMPFEVTAEKVYAAILVADKLGSLNR